MQKRWQALLSLAHERDASGATKQAIEKHGRWRDPVALHDEHGPLALIPRWAALALGAEMAEPKGPRVIPNPRDGEVTYPVAVVKLGVKEKP
jgi:hypothetical protein